MANENWKSSSKKKIGKHLEWVASGLKKPFKKIKGG
jgi:hypothetical protein